MPVEAQPGRSVLDLLGGAFIRLDRRRRAVFPDGWGDHQLIDDITAMESGTVPTHDIDIVWNRKEERHGARLRRGTFASPIADRLPIQSRAASVELWSPPTGDRAVVVILPAWNEEGFDRRRLLARPLVDLGVSSLLLEAPFYGGRRPDAWSSASVQPIRTVADFMLLGYSIVVEATALLREMRSIGTPGVTGYSMGGSLAALTAALSPFPVAAAPLAASNSPEAVVFDGMLGNGVSWGHFEEDEDRLRSVLDAANTLRHPARPHHATAVLVAATGDAFVPPSASHAIARPYDRFPIYETHRIEKPDREKGDGPRERTRRTGAARARFRRAGRRW